MAVAPNTTDNEQEHEHRRRLLMAMASVSSSKGFAAATIADIVRDAGVSKRSFYEHFSSKDACFLALYRAVCGAALRTLREAVVPDKPWQAQLEHALDAYFSQLASGPLLLKTLFVEIHHLGEAGAQARREVMQQLADFMLATVNQPCGSGHAYSLKPTLAMAAVGGINELVLQSIESGQAAKVRSLAPTACELVRLFAHVKSP